MAEERRVPLKNFLPLLNKEALFNISWGLKNLTFQKDMVKRDLEKILFDLSNYLIETNIKGIVYYDTFPVEVKENCIAFKEQNISWCFPTINNKCIAQSASVRNEVTLQVATLGNSINQILDTLSVNGESSKAYYIHGLSLWLTEALAEYGHEQIRQEHEIDGKKERYSFGYPLCPDLNMQSDLFNLLKIDSSSGVSLTNSYMMVPEQSTSAIIIS